MYKTICEGCKNCREEKTFRCGVSPLRDTSDRCWCNAMNPKTPEWKRLNSLARRGIALCHTGLTPKKEARFDQICSEFDKLAKEVCP